MSFWAQYVLAKETLGVDRSVSLSKIEDKYGTEFRQQVEVELTGAEG